MSKVMELVTPVTTHTVQRGANSRKFSNTEICSHCNQVIDEQHGEIAIHCGNLVFHEGHFSEYFYDCNDED